ncbi:acetyl-coenzyme A synthetase family protein [ [[Propionibacterium] namnetense SK182B-JCVI]|uniref:Acetyl-coenzyme A synthetase family protein n=1 Tax=[Propionibacterium] namnetense SK182B-JCVI TaxID=1051006 RepID=F9NTV6_9ACTN|nr:acetyl-coenzyme A synthetase family protein [ [[Propionibacterium] namnetense SK182B-JCVI]
MQTADRKKVSVRPFRWMSRTRSGKIMRRVLKARALGEDEGDLSTLEN